MPKPRSKPSSLPDELFPPRKRKPVPHEFVLDALAAVSPRTNPMFGCLAVYVQEKVVLILRDRPTAPADNGVWLATTVEHHASLRADFPSMRSIGVLGKDVTGWQILPADAPDFEEAALRACEMVIARDPRIGKVPKAKSRRATAAGARGVRKASQDESGHANPESRARRKKKNQPNKSSRKKDQPRKKLRKKSKKK
jgi:hypothetical protein